MIWIVLFLSMIWLHIYDDYHTQGILAQFKQKNGGKKTTHRIYTKEIG